jgi:hypothetical protein
MKLMQHRDKEHHEDAAACACMRSLSAQASELQYATAACGLFSLGCEQRPCRESELQRIVVNTKHKCVYCGWASVSTL